MLLSEEVEVEFSPKTFRYYEDLGYFFPRYKDSKGKIKIQRGTKIMVKVKDLKPNSSAKVVCLCDYCLEQNIKTIIIKSYVKYNICNVNAVINKDCCNSCIMLKHKETINTKYGVNYIGSLPKIQNKIKQTLIKNLGVDNPFKSELIQNRNRKIIYKKYGNENYAKTLYFKNSMSGKNNPSWKGGVTSLRRYLRKHIISWVKDSLKYYNFNCVITGENKNIVLHHLYKNFNELLYETLKNLNLELKENISFYSEKELNLLSKEILRIHYLYGYGIPLKKELHIDFHNNYGYKNNNEKQFLEYCNKVKEETYNECFF